MKRITDENEKLEAEKQQNCAYCDEPLPVLRKNYRDAVIDHCHITGRYRGAAHSDCNKKLRISPKTDAISVIFHNLEGYDTHHLFQGVYSTNKEMKNCIAKNMENYITFTVGGLRFIDSLNFMKAILDSLVKAMPKEQLKTTELIANVSREKLGLICKKGIYPYEYMDGWERFEETRLPGKEKFYSSLNDENITDEEYEHAQAVWRAFGCETLGDYHDLYVKTDVALLADVFENFRNLCQEHYGLEPVHYYASPGLSWDALLKPKKFIAYEDANNLYGWAMSKPLPVRDFKWKRVMPTEEEILAKKENARNGFWRLIWNIERNNEQYKEALFGAKQFRHGMEIIRSEGYEMFNMHINKISLSPFNSKRWIDEDGIHTKAYGYTEPEMEAEEGVYTEEELAEMEAGLLVLLGVHTYEELS